MVTIVEVLHPGTHMATRMDTAMDTDTDMDLGMDTDMDLGMDTDMDLGMDTDNLGMDTDNLGMDTDMALGMDMETLMNTATDVDPDMHMHTATHTQANEPTIVPAPPSSRITPRTPTVNTTPHPTTMMTDISLPVIFSPTGRSSRVDAICSGRATRRRKSTWMRALTTTRTLIMMGRWVVMVIVMAIVTVAMTGICAIITIN